MIAHLSGKVLFKSSTSSVLECGGVGYEIFHTPWTAELLGQDRASVFVHTHVREDALQLFAFASQEERSLFRELLKVSSIGPKMAMSILSGIPHQELVEAIARKDTSRLQKIPGIGKKTAERLGLELSDKISQTSFSPNLRSPSIQKEDELESVLSNLGYQRMEIQKALKIVRDQQKDFVDTPLEALVKITLKELSQKAIS